MSSIRDARGNLLRVGDLVVKVATDDGVPLYVNSGEVVGLGRTRAYVQWAASWYDEKMPHHAAVPSAIRRADD